MDLATFMDSVITTPGGGHLNISTVPGTGKGNSGAGWQEHWFEWPKQQELAVEAALRDVRTANVYFSAHLFDRPNSRKEYVLPSATVQADLDSADPATLPVRPAYLLQTSCFEMLPRHQAFWILEKPLPPGELEQIARRISRVEGVDPTGWTAGHRMRLPDTFNLKYPTPQQVKVVGSAVRRINPTLFEAFPELVETLEKAEADCEWLDSPDEPFEIGPRAVMEIYTAGMSAKAKAYYDNKARDRSAAAWLMMCEMFKQNAPRNHVLYVVRASANNKFKDRAWGGEYDLRKDVLRAEQRVFGGSIDPRSQIMEIKVLKNIVATDKYRRIAQVVITTMKEDGELIHAEDGRLWFLRRDIGRPIPIETRSNWLNSYLNVRCGINAAEQDHTFSCQELIAYVRSMPQSWAMQKLSWYNESIEKLYIHTGRKDVLEVTGDRVIVSPNGTNALFRWIEGVEPFRWTGPPAEDVAWHVAREWDSLMFGDYAENLVTLDAEEARCLFRAFTLFLLFRDAAETRPILALFGQQGSGKTTTMHKLYRLLYGDAGKASLQLASVDTYENYVSLVSDLPFAAIDNVDGFIPWMPNALAQSAGVVTLTKRELWTNTDVVRQRLDAVVALTAHNPKINRADVVDRLLLLNYKQIPHDREQDHDLRMDEKSMIRAVTNNRDDLWRSIVTDCQAVLRTPRPALREAPSFRVMDFSLLGAWFARARGPEELELFHRAMSKVVRDQRTENITTDGPIIEALNAYVNKSKLSGQFRATGELYNELSLLTTDDHSFTRLCRDARALGTRLWVLMDSLKTVFSVEWKDTPKGRQWKISKLLE